MRLAEIFAANLKGIRSSKRMTHEVLATRANVSKSYLSMLEHGARTPALATIESLAIALGCAPLALLDSTAARRHARTRNVVRTPARKR